MQFKVIPFVAMITDTGGAQNVASQLQSLIANEALDGSGLPARSAALMLNSSEVGAAFRVARAACHARSTSFARGSPCDMRRCACRRPTASTAATCLAVGVSMNDV